MAQTTVGARKIAAKHLGLTYAEYLARLDAGMKHCTKCRTWKRRREFGRDASRGDGLAVRCRDCTHVAEDRRHLGHPSSMKGKRMQPESCRKMSAATRGAKNHRWKGGASLHLKPRDPMRLKARRAVNHAVDNSRLAQPRRLPCIRCGRNAHEYHHHLGYAPEHHLDVQALCRACHRNVHGTQ